MLMLAMAVYNTVYFLYKQKRYKIYFICVFYVVAYIVIFSRLTISVILTVFAFNPDKFYTDDGKIEKNMTVYILLVIEIIATYSKIIMGFFQVGAIVILTMQVK